jgi:hypothetical protein
LKNAKENFMSEKEMNNQRAIYALSDLRMYASSHSLDAIDYVIEVLQKLENAGIKNPLKSLNPEEQ